MNEGYMIELTSSVYFKLSQSPEYMTVTKAERDYKAKYLPARFDGATFRMPCLYFDNEGDYLIFAMKFL